MSKVSVEFKIDGAAFWDDDYEHVDQNMIGCTLDLVAQKIKMGKTEGSIHDINGNHIGEFKVEVDEG